ncbi:hypothetical protein ACFSAG_02090 [Sphingorhabdus buctiana]|uniref:Uncharacterized protein n=1 Tax=Sphingorhabdus buctiana TaxID=1508805 RepID=A0ABW4M9L1_9SPHN
MKSADPNNCDFFRGIF